MGSLEIQDVFEPYFDRGRKTAETRQTIEIVTVKHECLRTVRGSEAKARDTKVHVARDVEPRS